jgi:hypothetical protein
VGGTRCYARIPALCGGETKEGGSRRIGSAQESLPLPPDDTAWPSSGVSSAALKLP